MKAGGNRWTNPQQGSDRALFVAISGEQAVGLTALVRLPGLTGTGELHQVWVAPGYRGKGLARDLMDAVFAWARANDLPHDRGTDHPRQCQGAGFLSQIRVHALRADPTG